MILIANKFKKLFMIDDSIYDQINGNKDYKEKVKFVKKFCLENGFVYDEYSIDELVSPIKCFADKVNYMANYSNIYYDQDVLTACGVK